MLSIFGRRSLTPPALLRLADEQPPSAIVAGASSHCGTAAAPEQVSLVIPTQRRPEGLARAARSAFRQSGVDPARLELVVVDNDEVPSAAATTAQMREEAPFPVRYVHEPRPGVANARNTGISSAAGQLIAFLDDDEEATEGWLAALLETQARFEADVVFGPVRARAPASVGTHRGYLEAFYSREGPAEAGLVDNAYGCGDSLVRRASLPDPDRPFSPSRNQTGGEDDHLFQAMRNSGVRFAWAPAALVFEDPALERLTLGYTLLRAFAYGQGPTYSCATSDPPQWLGVVRWMAIGAGQALIFGAAAALQWIARTPHRAFTLDQAVRGLGKVFFGGPFALRFYGRRRPKASGAPRRGQRPAASGLAADRR